MIPKVIHYVWLSGDKKPREIRKCMKSWRRVLPDYEIKEWTLEDFPEDALVPFVKEALACRKWAFATDYLRLWILYREGGIYLDSDILMKRRIDEFLDNGFFTFIELHRADFLPYRDRIDENGLALVPEHVPGFCLQAAFMGAEKENEFVSSCMEAYKDRHFLKADKTPDTGILAPDIYALCARQYGFRYKDCEQRLDAGISVYPSSFVAGARSETSPENYAVHCCAGSWRDKSGNEAYAEKKAAVVFLARDCAGTLPAFLRSLEELRTFFAESRVFIVENNSRDGTKELLKSCAEAAEGMVLDSFDEPEYDKLERIRRMCVLRNRGLDLAKASGFPSDYLVLLDGDVMFDAFSVMKALRNAPEGWAALFADGRYYLTVFGRRLPVLYYDLFAYVPEGEGPESLTEEEMLNGRASLQRALRRRPYMRCRSAFGGAAVYRWDAVKDLSYNAEKSTAGDRFEHLSEHIPFHRALVCRGGLYICRDMKVLYEELPFRIFLREALRDLGVRKAYDALLRRASSSKLVFRGRKH